MRRSKKTKFEEMTESNNQFLDLINPPGENWKKWFLSKKSTSWLVDVSDDYIRDKFNLYSLNEVVPSFDICCNVITNDISLSDISTNKRKKIETNLPLAYGLIHSRYIMSPEGMQRFNEKFSQGKYGTCPRYCCEKQNLLPIGLTSTPKDSLAKLYCPRCKCIYEPPSPTVLDGAFFGPNASHLLIDNMHIKIHNKIKKFPRLVCGFRVYDPVVKAEC